MAKKKITKNKTHYLKLKCKKKWSKHKKGDIFLMKYKEGLVDSVLETGFFEILAHLDKNEKPVSVKANILKTTDKLIEGKKKPKNEAEEFIEKIKKEYITPTELSDKYKEILKDPKLFEKMVKLELDKKIVGEEESRKVISAYCLYGKFYTFPISE